MTGLTPEFTGKISALIDSKEGRIDCGDIERAIPGVRHDEGFLSMHIDEMRVLPRKLEILQAPGGPQVFIEMDIEAVYQGEPFWRTTKRMMIGDTFGLLKINGSMGFDVLLEDGTQLGRT